MAGFQVLAAKVFLRWSSCKVMFLVFQLCAPPLPTEVRGADMTPPCRATAGTQGRTPGDPGHQRRSPGVSQSPRVLLRAHFRALVLVLGGGSEATPSRAAPRSLPAFRQLLPGPTAPPGDAPEGRAEPPRPPQPPPRPWTRPPPWPQDPGGLAEGGSHPQDPLTLPFP